MPGRADDRAGLQIDPEVAFGELAGAGPGIGDWREHVDPALLHRLARGLIAVVAIAKDSLRAQPRGLHIDQFLGMCAVVPARVSHLDRANQRALGVAHRGMQLVTGEPTELRLVTSAHVGIVR